MSNVKVKIHGREFWFRDDGDGNGPIAPLEHCNEDGSLNIRRCFDGPTFAHVMDGKVLRYGSVLGTKEDLLAGELK